MPGRLRSLGSLRVILLVAGIGAAGLSAGYLVQSPLATATWPFPVTPLTYQFLAAYTLGTAAVLVWIAVTGELGGVAPLGLTTAVAYAGIGLVLAGLVGREGRLVVNVALSAALVLVGLAGFVYGLRAPLQDARRMTRPLLGVYALVAVLLLAIGVPMVLRVPDVMPWEIDLDSGALIGWFFVASAAYFTFALVRPTWPYAAGQLIALFAYDLILAWPLIAHVPAARPVHLAVLTIYIAVVLGSAVLAAYVFFVDRRTRLGSTG
jgi:hypothetical protein